MYSLAYLSYPWTVEVVALECQLCFTWPKPCPTIANSTFSEEREGLAIADLIIINFARLRVELASFLWWESGIGRDLGEGSELEGAEAGLQVGAMSGKDHPDVCVQVDLAWLGCLKSVGAKTTNFQYKCQFYNLLTSNKSDTSPQSLNISLAIQLVRYSPNLQVYQIIPLFHEVNSFQSLFPHQNIYTATYPCMLISSNLNFIKFSNKPVHPICVFFFFFFF